MTAGNHSVSAAEVEERFEKSKQLRVACLVSCEMGHFTPMVRLAAALEKRGHHVTILTNNYFKDKCVKMCEQNNIQGDLLFPDADLGFERMMGLNGWKGKDKGKLLPLQCDQKLADATTAALKELQPDICVVDTYMTYNQMSADSLGLP